MSKIDQNNEMIHHLNESVSAIKTGQIGASMEYLTALMIPVLADISQSLAIIADIIEAQITTEQEENDGREKNVHRENYRK